MTEPDRPVAGDAAISRKRFRRRIVWLTVAALILLFIASYARLQRDWVSNWLHEDWHLDSVERTSTDDGLSLVTVSLKRESVRVQCSMVLFRASEFDLVVIDNGPSRAQPRFSNLAEAMRASGCLAGSNGGFFDLGTFEPNGLMVCNRGMITRFDRKNWADGVITVRDSAPLLQRRDEFLPDAPIREALQSGPWLVRDAKPQRGFQNDIADHPRTFLATDDGGGMWALGHVSETTLGDLARMLRSSPITTIFPIHTALNFDGGPSSGLWVRLNEKDARYLEERTVVRNFLGIRKRRERPRTEKSG